jgi:hypothetical protein
MLGLDLLNLSFAEERQKALSLLFHLRYERGQRNRAGGWGHYWDERQQ